jgi:CRP-like cAMP-binding protein
MKLSKLELKDLITKFYPILQDNEIEQFLTIAEYKKVKKKELLLKSGRTDKYVILILKGSARAYSIDDNGDELNNYIRPEGHLIGDARVFGNNIDQVLNIESISILHYLKFDISQLESLGYDNPKLMTFYLGFLKEIVVTLSHRVHTFVTMTSKERYEDLVKWNPNYLESTSDKNIASFLGVKPLTLHRIKKK